MKKFIVPVVAIIIGIIIPIAGMTITPTRDLILGLAPNEAVLQLADKIDENRINSDAKLTESDQKIAELQSTVDAQQAKLVEQQQVIDEQNIKVSTQAAQVQLVVSKIDTECRKKMEYTNKLIQEEQDNIANGIKVDESKSDLAGLLKIKARTSCD